MRPMSLIRALLVCDLGSFTVICEVKKSWAHSDIIALHKSEISLVLLWLLDCIYFTCASEVASVRNSVHMTLNCWWTLRHWNGFMIFRGISSVFVRDTWWFFFLELRTDSGFLIIVINIYWIIDWAKVWARHHGKISETEDRGCSLIKLPEADIAKDWPSHQSFYKVFRPVLA